MKYYIIAGEASGDLHASNLIKELKLKDSNSDFRCWGGDLMEKQGGVLVKHYRDLAFMGFVEVLFNLKTILGNISFCKKDILDFKPDALILVDYPGFNLRIAEFAKNEGIKVFYYISPQIWAWKQSRVKKIQRDVDKMFVILPFEKEFYKNHNVDVDFVGHPLLDAISNYSEKSDITSFRTDNDLGDKPIIAILPGSRKQEITKMLPIMLSVIEEFSDYQFVIAGASSVPIELYQSIIKNSKVKIIIDKTYDILRSAKAGLITSGTATLETALFELPEVVCYKANYLSYKIAKSIVKIKYISLANLVMDREIVKELVQNNLNKKNIILELKELLNNENKRKEISGNYKLLKEKLGGGGASEKTASLIYLDLVKGSA
ncbi:MAG: lipid-A-disaccharide synthase [Saprospiraceae bacterium]|nr:lipid-A-disaccharide synthase [Saprospiraceae bacterium]